MLTLFNPKRCLRCSNIVLWPKKMSQFFHPQLRICFRIPTKYQTLAISINWKCKGVWPKVLLIYYLLQWKAQKFEHRILPIQTCGPGGWVEIWLRGNRYKQKTQPPKPEDPQHFDSLYSNYTVFGLHENINFSSPQLTREVNELLTATLIWSFVAMYHCQQPRYGIFFRLWLA